MSVTNTVFVPTGLAYCWVFVEYVISGWVLYLAVMAIAYKLGMFDRVNEWPRASQVALVSGLPLMLLGSYSP